MTTLTVDDFPTYFRDVHGYEPFPWQKRLTRQVMESGQWPDVIDLPTGTGKTAVLDTALFSLAAQPDIFPRRVIFVIDRRIIVDQVYKRAELIQEKIAQPDSEVLQKVQFGLGAAGGEQVLGVAALRGGIPIDNEWAHRPDLPWVVVSTVDQFGSRLLFRGYGVSKTMRPIHAGLAGNDCLVILDEVHLSRPFAETLGGVARLYETQNGPLPRRFQVVAMSATPSKVYSTAFQLGEDDLAASSQLRQRVEAQKRASLVEVKGSKPPHESIPGAVVKIVSKQLPPEVRSVGVVVNRVRTARETNLALHKAGYNTHLITGRMRPLDRERILADFQNVVDPDRSENADGLTVVVATQAIEVGADFSFDALITECAPVDSLRQRFGRLDRRGSYAIRHGTFAPAWILGVASALNHKKPDPIYGDSARVTWEELNRISALDPDNLVDVGPRDLQSRDFPPEGSAPVTNAPLLLKTHIEAWVQTNPEPPVQPSLDWFLHGIEDRVPQPDVVLVWRRDLSPETLRIVPPRPAEFLQIPIGAAKAWLSGEPELPVGDVDTFTGETSAQKSNTSKREIRWVRWEGYEEGAQSIPAGMIKPGNVLIVSSDSGGLSHGTWDPAATEPVSDLGDQSQLEYGKRATLRLDSKLLDGLPAPPTPREEAEADSPVRERIKEWLQQDSDFSEWRKKAASSFLQGNFEVKILQPDSGDDSEDAYYVLVQSAVDTATMDGSDYASSVTGAGVTLDSHLNGVGDKAALYAQRLGLSPELQEDLRLAGRLHDIGKSDPRFQLGLVGGDEVLLASLDEPLAKSIPGRANVWPYPKGMRHEVASVALISSAQQIVEQAHDPDLVLHLVGTHHGHCRPLPPIFKDNNPQLLQYSVDGHDMQASSDLVDSCLALDMAERFWSLVEKYGFHGLAWLEAILRLADHRRSQEEAG